MNRYIIGRVLFVIPIMLILSFFTFALTYLSPSDPITLKYERMGAVPDKALVEAEKTEAGLYDPFLVQYFRWLKQVLVYHDLGVSLISKAPVGFLIGSRLANSVRSRNIRVSQRKIYDVVILLRQCEKFPSQSSADIPGQIGKYHNCKI